MLKWFFRWLHSKMQDSQYADEEPVMMIGSTKSARNRKISVRESDDFASEPIMFKMYKASGGWAIEFKQYDHKNDRVDTNLYVVTDEEELGRHISQIITMEALRR